MRRRLRLLGDGRIAHLPGGIEQYLEQRRAEQTRRRAAAPRRAAAAAARGSGLRQARKDADRLERELGRLDEREAELHALLADARDGLRARGGARRASCGALRRSACAAEEAWLEAAALLEAG